MKKLVSIIIVNYNKNQYNPITVDCLKSLTNQTYTNFEVILVDNNSKKKNFEFLKSDLTQFENQLKIKLVRSKRNLFFAGGNNKAIKISRGSILCLLNNDTVVLPQFIEKMVDFLENNPHAGFICPKIKSFSNRKFIWYAGGSVSLKYEKLIKIRGRWELDPSDQKYNEISPTDFAAGTSLFFKKELIEKIGMMDEIFFMYHEDPDWNLRAQKIGYKNYYVPTTTVYHKVSRSRGKRFALFNTYLIHRNLQILAWKNLNYLRILLFYVKYCIVNAFEVTAYLLLSSLPDLVYQFLSRKLELPYKDKKLYIYAAYLRCESLRQGFIIGLRRRTHRSCRKNLIRDYNFIIKQQRIINSI